MGLRFFLILTCDFLHNLQMATKELYLLGDG